MYYRSILHRLNLTQEMVAWGIGKVGDSAISNFLSIFLLYYYNQILGLDPVLASLALAIAMLTDAVSDPIIGFYSDFQNLTGKRRTDLMKLSVIPCCTIFLALFLLDVSSSDLALFTQLTSLTILLRLCLTLYAIPREAIGVQTFKTYSDRNRLWALNSFFSVLGASLALGPTLLFFITDWDNKAEYINAVVWTTLIYFTVSSWCSYQLRKIEIVSSQKKTDEFKFSLTIMVREIKSLFRNRSWVALFIGCLIFSIQIGLNSGTGLYLNNFLWRWEPNDLFWGGFLSLPGSIIGALIIIYYDIRNKKRWAISLGLIAIFATPTLLSIRLIEISYSTNLLPSIGDGVLSPLWWLWGIQQFIQNLVWTAFWVLIASMFSDTIEQQEIATGRRLDGLVLSANNFVTKAILSSGIFVSGIILSFAGYDTAVTITEKESAAFKLGKLSIITTITLVPIALFFISKYRITSSIHETNLRKIENSIKANID
tara:strand:+ start:548 stop:1999 length:1452 start_codon:yes stop_codon:yes gene_type:complete